VDVIGQVNDQLDLLSDSFDWPFASCRMTDSDMNLEGSGDWKAGQG
jgi:hypothetical protein